MVSSETALMYVYVLWLLGRRDFGVELKRLREVIARWWFMAHTTGRYTGSSETQIEADLNRASRSRTGDADKFCEHARQDRPRHVHDRLLGDHSAEPARHLIGEVAGRSRRTGRR